MPGPWCVSMPSSRRAPSPSSGGKGGPAVCSGGFGEPRRLSCSGTLSFWSCAGTRDRFARRFESASAQGRERPPVRSGRARRSSATRGRVPGGLRRAAKRDPKQRGRSAPALYSRGHAGSGGSRIPARAGRVSGFASDGRGGSSACCTCARLARFRSRAAGSASLKWRGARTTGFHVPIFGSTISARSGAHNAGSDVTGTTF